MTRIHALLDQRIPFAALIIVASFLAACSGDSTTEPTTTTRPPTNPTRQPPPAAPDEPAATPMHLPTEIAVEDCLTETIDAQRTVFTIADCTDTYQHQVIAIIGIVAAQDDTYPSEDVLHAQATDGCGPAYETSPLGAPTGRTFGYITPNAEMWEAGERRIICIASP